jgi:hypothetical protein
MYVVKVSTWQDPAEVSSLQVGGPKSAIRGTSPLKLYTVSCPKEFFGSDLEKVFVKRSCRPQFLVRFSWFRRNYAGRLFLKRRFVTSLTIQVRSLLTKSPLPSSSEIAKLGPQTYTRTGRHLKSPVITVSVFSMSNEVVREVFR